jgi:hypothetical protein
MLEGLALVRLALGTLRDALRCRPAMQCLSTEETK